MLEQFVQTKGMGVITTHYNNLKKLGDAHPGLVNGRMRFDVKHLEPLYQLEIGKPGSSFALEIAGKIGLSKKLIHEAKKKVGTDAVELDRLLNDWKKRKRLMRSKVKSINLKMRHWKKHLKITKNFKSELIKRKEIINEARQEAKHI
jgi:DNA mismatch repair protein MutS2